MKIFKVIVKFSLCPEIIPSRDMQIANKILDEIKVIEDIIAGFDLETFQADERTKRASCMA